MPRSTSSRGTTPDSRSRIIHPSVRTVSLTQNGTRHSTKSSDCARPFAILAMYHAAGKRDRERGDRRDDRHRRRAHERPPVERLLEERPVLRETPLEDARRDARAERQERELDVRQHDEPDEPHQRRRDQQEQRETRARTCRPRGRRRHEAAGKADGALGSKPNAMRSPGARSARRRSAAARCGTRGAYDASRTSTAEFAPSKSRLSTSPSNACAEGGSSARSRASTMDSGRTNATTASPFEIAPRRRARSRNPAGVESSTVSPPALARPSIRLLVADERGHERRVRMVVELLRRADLLEATGVHHGDAIRQHECFRLIVRDVDERRAEAAPAAASTRSSCARAA